MGISNGLIEIILTRIDSIVKDNEIYQSKIYPHQELISCAINPFLRKLYKILLQLKSDYKSHQWCKSILFE